jgi:hypothetical protein
MAAEVDRSLTGQFSSAEGQHLLPCDLIDGWVGFTVPVDLSDGARVRRIAWTGGKT